MDPCTLRPNVYLQNLYFATYYSSSGTLTPEYLAMSVWMSLPQLSPSPLQYMHPQHLAIFHHKKSSISSDFSGLISNRSDFDATYVSYCKMISWAERFSIFRASPFIKSKTKASPTRMCLSLPLVLRASLMEHRIQVQCRSHLQLRLAHAQVQSSLVPSHRVCAPW